MLYTALRMLGCARSQLDFEVTLDNELSPTTFKAFRPTHQNHPCVKWIMNHKTHFEWTLQHGLAMAKVKQNRYPNTPRPLCWYHLEHIRDLYLHSDWTFPSKPIEELLNDPQVSVASVNPPEGCSCGVLAFEKNYPQCVVYQGNDIDWTASYAAYYRVREQEFSTTRRPMRWEIVLRQAPPKKRPRSVDNTGDNQQSY